MPERQGAADGRVDQHTNKHKHSDPDIVAWVEVKFLAQVLPVLIVAWLELKSNF